MNTLARAINLNADLGEGFGPYRLGDDAALLDIVTTANIACGFHAGDPGVMRATLEVAAARGVSIGAHPGFADREGFGRRPLPLTPAEIETMAAYQIGALVGVAALVGTSVSHVKAHGALHALGVEDAAVADAIVRAGQRVDPSLIQLVPPRSALEAAARRAGAPLVLEGFADRAYFADGRLAPRGSPGAVLSDPSRAAAQALEIAETARVVPVGGGPAIDLPAQSLCVHGDTPGGVAVAGAVRRALETAGFALQPLPALLSQV